MSRTGTKFSGDNATWEERRRYYLKEFRRKSIIIVLCTLSVFGIVALISDLMAENSVVQEYAKVIMALVMLGCISAHILLQRNLQRNNGLLCRSCGSVFGLNSKRTINERKCLKCGCPLAN